MRPTQFFWSMFEMEIKDFSNLLKKENTRILNIIMTESEPASSELQRLKDLLTALKQTTFTTAQATTE